MRRWNDVEAMIFEPTIDRRTEEKMLHGTLDPEDAPPELARVALILRAASAGAELGSIISETDRLRREQVVASMVAAVAAAGVPTQAKPATVRSWKLRGGALGRVRLVVTMALGLMLASAGLAFAGALPSPMQHAASVFLSKVGVHVPDPGRTTGSSAGHEPAGGFTGPLSSGGYKGKGRNLGKHVGQYKNGNNGHREGQGKGGKGTTGNHGSGGDPRDGQTDGRLKAHSPSGKDGSPPLPGGGHGRS
jgi:hypothetical protein